MNHPDALEQEQASVDYIVALTNLRRFYSENKVEEVRAKLATFSASTLSMIATTASKQLDKRVNDLVQTAVSELPETLVREVMFYRLLIDEPDESPEYIMQHIIGLHLLNRYQGRDHLELLTGEELAVATSLLNVTTALNDYSTEACLAEKEYKGHTGGYIKNPALQSLIAEHYQQSESIIDYIKERGNADLSSLRDLVENGTVLSAGVL